jgi:isoleucyl-tRNA synthetase
VLDILFHALVRYAAPVLVFTAEEVWQTRFPDEAESVHYLDWPEVSELWISKLLSTKWEFVRRARDGINEATELLRRDKLIGSTLGAKVWFQTADPDALSALNGIDMSEIGICGSTLVGPEGWSHGGVHMIQLLDTTGKSLPAVVHVDVSDDHKCGRCWRHVPEVTEDGTLCGRCEDVVNG